MRGKRRKGSSLRAIALKGLSLIYLVGLAAGVLFAIQQLGFLPQYKSAKQLAKEALDKERDAVTKAKAEVPELYPETVEFYIRDLQEAYDKAPDTR